MADIEVIKIPELDPAVTANPEDDLILRQGVIDKRISVSALKSSIIVGATASTPGVVQLNNTTTSTSISQAGTANSVRLAYNRGTEALNVANSALNGLNGKANTSHTHDASQITSGVMYWERLPQGSFSSHGIVRIDQSNGGQSSNNGYVPSVERINNIQQQIFALTQIISDVESGVAFMPLPLNNIGEPYTREFPIGTYLLASGGPNVGTRGMRCYISLADLSSPYFGNSHIGQYSLSESPSSSNLSGLWVARGAVGAFHNPVSKGLKGFLTGTGADYNELLNVAFLCQRVG